MKLKKALGGLMLALTAVVINSGAASLLFVGNEDMPKSLKEKR